MLELTISGMGEMTWRYLLLDVNGTLALDGVLIAGVAERIQVLTGILEIQLITANTHGTVEEIARTLGVGYVQILPGQEAQQKQALVAALGGDQVIAMGNGSNDALMLHDASLGVVVLGPEGSSTKALEAADMVAPSILIALDLLLQPARLAATLRS